MITRILPPEEWSKLDGTGLQIATATPSEVVVVEDEKGLAACVTVARVTLMECLWIRPDARGNAGVARALKRATFSRARAFGPLAFCGADREDVADYWRRMNGIELPARWFAMPLEG